MTAETVSHRRSRLMWEGRLEAEAEHSQLVMRRVLFVPSTFDAADPYGIGEVA